MLVVRRWPEQGWVVLVAAAGLIALAIVLAVAPTVALADLVLLVALAVALVALELGAVAGLAAAAIGFALVAAHNVTRHLVTPLDELGMALALLALAAVAGHFSDRMRGLRRRSERLLESGLLLGQPPGKNLLAANVAEAVMLTVRAAGVRVCFDGGEPVSLGRTESRQLVAALVAGDCELGWLEVFGAAELSPEDRAAARLVALQAGLARRNQLAMLQEAERIRVESELRRAEERLREQHSELDYLVRSQEDERRLIAHKLHEELAQVLAAVIMGLELVSRHASLDPGAVVADLRAQVVGVLDELRHLAGELTPPTLDQLGLVPALESLARDANEHGETAVVLDSERLSLPLSGPIATVAYRIVSEVLELARRVAATPSLRVSVGERIRPSGNQLELALELPEMTVEPVLAGIQARVKLAGGVLESETSSEAGTRLLVTLPLAAPNPTAAAA